MKVLCYVDGDARDAQQYAGETPYFAAKLYAEEWHDDSLDVLNVVVEPLDEEAGQLLKWTTRPDGARVRLFRVTPFVVRNCEEVPT